MAHRAPPKKKDLDEARLKLEAIEQVVSSFDTTVNPKRYSSELVRLRARITQSIREWNGFLRSHNIDPKTDPDIEEERGRVVVLSERVNQLLHNFIETHAAQPDENRFVYSLPSKGTASDFIVVIGDPMTEAGLRLRSNIRSWFENTESPAKWFYVKEDTDDEDQKLKRLKEFGIDYVSSDALNGRGFDVYRVRRKGNSWVSCRLESERVSKLTNSAYLLTDEYAGIWLRHLAKNPDDMRTIRREALTMVENGDAKSAIDALEQIALERWKGMIGDQAASWGDFGVKLDKATTFDNFLSVLGISRDHSTDRLLELADSMVKEIILCRGYACLTTKPKTAEDYVKIYGRGQGVRKDETSFSYVNHTNFKSYLTFFKQGAIVLVGDPTTVGAKGLRETLDKDMPEELMLHRIWICGISSNVTPVLTELGIPKTVSGIGVYHVVFYKNEWFVRQYNKDRLHALAKADKEAENFKSAVSDFRSTTSSIAQLCKQRARLVGYESKWRSILRPHYGNIETDPDTAVNYAEITVGLRDIAERIRQALIKEYGYAPDSPSDDQIRAMADAKREQLAFDDRIRGIRKIRMQPDWRKRAAELEKLADEAHDIFERWKAIEDKIIFDHDEEDNYYLKIPAVKRIHDRMQAALERLQPKPKK